MPVQVKSAPFASMNIVKVRLMVWSDLHREAMATKNHMDPAREATGLDIEREWIEMVQ